RPPALAGVALAVAVDLVEPAARGSDKLGEMSLERGVHVGHVDELRRDRRAVEIDRRIEHDEPREVHPLAGAEGDKVVAPGVRTRGRKQPPQTLHRGRLDRSHDRDGQLPWHWLIPSSVTSYEKVSAKLISLSWFQ